MPQITAHELLHGLHIQVRNAMPAHGDERDVITYATRAMWRMFLAAVGDDEHLEPTPWLGTKSRHIWGSETHIIESDELFSFSYSKYTS